MSLLEVNDLSIRYPGAQRAVVAGLSFAIARGESVGLVGESGSGKTQTALATISLLPANARIEGDIRFDGTALLRAPQKTLNRFRQRRVAMIFQDPLAAMNPYVRVGEQLRRILLEHKLCASGAAKQRVTEMLARVGLTDPERQYRSYPHQLSGGMRQRVMIGAALLGEPELLIADEPTTALDVTVQAQILDMLRELRAESGVALLLISHDLGVIAAQCDRTLVMDGGKLLEDGATRDVFALPASEKMRALLAVAPRISRVSSAPMSQPGKDIVLDVEDVAVDFIEKRRRRLHAVHSMTLALRHGETVAIVGESGSGKTSVARAVLGLLPAATGRVAFLGEVLPPAVTRRSLATHRDLQMVFQDPLASLNPTMRVAEIVAEPLRIHATARGDQSSSQAVTDMLERVGLGKKYARRLPHELSGGQAQRVAIARALIVNPRVLICDEAVAALDGTIQNEILALLQAEQQRTGLAMLFITHDLAVVRQISHRIVVMYMGRVCEIADNATLFTQPRHPYTRALLNAVPEPDPALPRMKPSAGEVASILDPPAGCPFQPRCPEAVSICSTTLPGLQRVEETVAACHRSRDLDLSR